jgi:hypothetical protein
MAGKYKVFKSSLSLLSFFLEPLPDKLFVHEPLVGGSISDKAILQRKTSSQQPKTEALQQESRATPLTVPCL